MFQVISFFTRQTLSSKAALGSHQNRAGENSPFRIYIWGQQPAFSFYSGPCWEWKSHSGLWASRRQETHPGTLSVYQLITAWCYVAWNESLSPCTKTGETIKQTSGIVHEMMCGRHLACDVVNAHNMLIVISDTYFLYQFKVARLVPHWLSPSP